jgi:hypothetical protein
MEIRNAYEKGRGKTEKEAARGSILEGDFRMELVFAFFRKI